MDIFFMVRHHKTTIFLDAKENTTIIEVKRMIEGILKYPTSCQQLFCMISENTEEMADGKFLSDYGYVQNVAKAQLPATIGLATKSDESAEFEALAIEPLSEPPPLPDVMKQPETVNQTEQTATAS